MLSSEQQNIIENSIWIVNLALKRQNIIYNEDLRQSAILYMCKCLLRYDATKNIKWSTFAFKNVYLYIKRQNKKNTLMANYETKQDFFYNIIPKNVELNQSSMLVDNILNLLSPIEQKILKLKYNGYNNVEISSFMKCSVSAINYYLKNIRKKIKQYSNEKVMGDHRN